MARQSGYGESHGKNIDILCRRIRSNAAYIDADDIKLLERLSIKSESTPKQIPFIDEVEKFNEVMGKDYQNRTTPTINKKDAQFVVDFIREETNELEEAIENNDIVEILDALVDITYVATGNGVLVFGLKDKFLGAYADVQKSNLSKACNNEQEAIDTEEAMMLKHRVPYYHTKVKNKFIVYRESDNKVGKNINFYEPNLKQFFTEKEIEDCKQGK